MNSSTVFQPRMSLSVWRRPLWSKCLTNCSFLLRMWMLSKSSPCRQWHAKNNAPSSTWYKFYSAWMIIQETSTSKYARGMLGCGWAVDNASTDVQGSDWCGSLVNRLVVDFMYNICTTSSITKSELLSSHAPRINNYSTMEVYVAVCVPLTAHQGTPWAGPSCGHCGGSSQCHSMVPPAQVKCMGHALVASLGCTFVVYQFWAFC